MSVKVTYRKDRNKWQVTYWVDGKRNRPLFPTEREANDFKRKVLLGLTREGKESITLEDAIKSYFHDVTLKTKSRTSQKNDERYFDLLFGFLDHDRGIKYLDEVTLQDLEACQHWLLEIKEFLGRPVSMSPSTVNRAFHSIRHLFKKHVQWGNIQTSPCAYLDNLKAQENERRPMTKAEFEKAFAKAPLWFRPAFKFIHLTGAPPSCVERLTFDDVDFDRRTFRFRREKGGIKSIIEIPMIDEVFELLSSQFVRLRIGAVFRNEGLEPLTATWCSRVGNKAIRDAGVCGVVLYSLRHALATDLTNANVATELARQAMGHKSITTTQRYAKKAKSDSLIRALSVVRGGSGGS